MSQNSLHTEGVIGDYFTIETHILSTRSADAFKAVDKSRGDSIALWMLRYPLAINSDIVGGFLDRLHLVDQIEPSLTEMTAFGVDAEGMAFATFPPLDGQNIISGNIGGAEGERRFMSALKLIARLHAANLTCGDLCGSSFWVKRGGEISFVGVMGSFDVGAAATAMAPPVETLAFLSPEQRGGQGFSAQSDVYALGVLGYFLLTGAYPFGEGMSSMTNPGDIRALKDLRELIGSPPVWGDEILRKCLAPQAADRFRSAAELLETLQSIKDRAFSEEVAPLKLKNEVATVKQSQSSSEETFENLPLTGLTTLPSTVKKLPVRSISIVLLIVLLSAGLALLLSDKFIKQNNTPLVSSNLKEELSRHRAAVVDDGLKEAIDVIALDEAALVDKAAQLDNIVNSDDPIAHDVLVKSAFESNTPKLRELSEEAIVNRARRLGLMRSAEQVRQWLNTVRSVQKPPAYQAILKAIDKTLPTEARNSALREAYATSPRVALRLAVAVALDLDQLNKYQPVISQLVGDSLKMEEAKEHSTLALVLSHSDLAMVFGEDIIQRREDIPDADILWLLGILANRNDINVRAIASMAVKRGVMSPIKALFLKIIRDRENIPPDVLNTLIRAASGVLSVSDIEALGRWYDVDAEKILLGICAEAQDDQVLREAFDILAGKSPSIEPSASLINWIRKFYWERRLELASAVGVLGNLDRVSESDVIKAFDAFDGFVRDSDLIHILIDTNNPLIVRLIINRYADLLNIGALISLLEDSDKLVRIAAVKALKGTNDLGALKLIIDRWEKERDPEVRKVYSDSFWAIKQREKN